MSKYVPPGIRRAIQRQIDRLQHGSCKCGRCERCKVRKARAAAKRARKAT